MGSVAAVRGLWNEVDYNGEELCRCGGGGMKSIMMERGVPEREDKSMKFFMIERTISGRKGSLLHKISLQWKGGSLLQPRLPLASNQLSH